MAAIRSAIFREAVTEALESDNPLLATVTARSLPFTDAIKSRFEVTLLEVRPNNREKLVSELTKVVLPAGVEDEQLPPVGEWNVPTAAPARSTTQGLASPVRRARSDGKPKIPLPTMELTTSAAKLHRPMARTRLDCSLPGKPCLYHSDRVMSHSQPNDYDPGQRFRLEHDW